MDEQERICPDCGRRYTAEGLEGYRGPPYSWPDDRCCLSCWLDLPPDIRVAQPDGAAERDFRRGGETDYA